ncbi:MAG: hypothetical protein JSV09_09835 [Thermoplasmata archaeon]|nr:MAG: hypothetical protein JSV09_09835 [Thermoplasmata archaeon]
MSDSQAMQWVREHIDDAHFVIGKLVYCGEMGVKVSRVHSDFTEQMEIRNHLYSEWYTEFLNRGIEGGGFWLLSADIYLDYDNYTVYYPGDSETCTIITNFSNEMAARRALSYFPPILKLVGNINGNDEDSLQIQLSVSNPNTLSLSYNVAGLPEGAGIDTNGYFSWSVPEAGIYNNV